MGPWLCRTDGIDDEFCGARAICELYDFIRAFGVNDDPDVLITLANVANMIYCKLFMNGAMPFP
ncbi:hypothetical protein D3C73_1597940 [compost metagenome]